MYWGDDEIRVLERNTTVHNVILSSCHGRQDEIPFSLNVEMIVNLGVIQNACGWSWWEPL
jgi:hypothetical protein